MASRSVVIAEPVRTAIGAFGGALKDVPAPDLGAVAIRAAVERAGLKPEKVETAAMGNVVQAGSKMNPSRQAAVQAGLPVTVPAMTVNRVCGSGAQAIVSAAQEILGQRERRREGMLSTHSRDLNDPFTSTPVVRWAQIAAVPGRRGDLIYFAPNTSRRRRLAGFIGESGRSTA